MHRIEAGNGVGDVERCLGHDRRDGGGDKEVSGQHQPGSVFSRGEEWFAVSMFPGTTIDPGTTVVVADVERGLLVVLPDRRRLTDALPAWRPERRRRRHPRLRADAPRTAEGA